MQTIFFHSCVPCGFSEVPPFFEFSAFSASSMSLITYAGYLAGHGALFFIGTGLAAAQLARVLKRTRFDDRASCWKGFVGCGWSGFWIWMGALGDYALLQFGAGLF